MPDYEALFRTWLIGVAGIATVLGTRIWAGQLPENEGAWTPVGAVLRLTEVNWTTWRRGGSAGTAEGALEAVVVATSRVDALRAVGAIRDALIAGASTTLRPGALASAGPEYDHDLKVWTQTLTVGFAAQES